jgi:long-subunit acyl-CoA synthetase (AMP-forming)
MHEFRAFEEALTTWAPDSPEGAAADPCELLRCAEQLQRSGGASVEPALWHAYLDYTRSTRFLSPMARAERERWVQTALEAIGLSEYRLDTMLAQRVRTHPDRLFLREARGSGAWTYEQAFRRMQTIATVLQSLGPRRQPRVALLSDNSVESACADLACLAYDILVTPLDVHLDAPTLTTIFDRLELNLALAGNQQQAERLEEVRTLTRHPFRILHLQPDTRSVADGDLILAEACARIGPDDMACHLGGRARRALSEPATVMFTSGSTGRPKGVVFTAMNLLSKRFARGGALPSVGEQEVLLCYLPLFHTFGRYLELMGSLYWGGTYVFAGNPSSENLIGLLQEVRPTGLIGVPLRWVQIRDACVDEAGATLPEEQQHAAMRQVVGPRLRWGLSAAGHLDKRVFRFFQRHGVELCSGFGMTEATGGITMTPPGEYVDETVGIPLPGIRVRLSEIGELQISGPYVARYLEPEEAEQDGWLATGDLFRQHPGGFLEIVDRVKDIYKNSKGQTVAPRKVEAQFEGVPGIKRVFLAGDGREYNTLLIVPERQDPVWQRLQGEEEVRAYFHQIVSKANQALSRYERVVNFTIVERDFELERGELTAKGSFRRKAISEHFSAEIRELYRSRQTEFTCDGVRVVVPRWFVRDQGWLDTDITADEHGLVAGADRRRLRVCRGEAGRVRLGELEYLVEGNTVDLGLFARQPALWVGNPQMASFCPCKDGWELSLRGVSPRVVLAAAREPSAQAAGRVGDARLSRAHELSVQALFGRGHDSLEAVQQLASMLGRAHDRLASVIRRRLEALARHPELAVRCLAYRSLLLDTLVPESSRIFPTFVESGLPFLDEQSIEIIARANLERRRLGAFRQRLYRYRTELSWPASPQVRQVFADIFKLLADFVRFHPEYFPEASLELNAWLLLDADPALAEAARVQLQDLTSWWERNVLPPPAPPSAWAGKVVFHDSLSGGELDRLVHLLRDTPLLQRSLQVAFDGGALDLEQIPQEGIWVSRLGSLHQRPMYRLSVNTCAGKHYDLLVMLVDGLEHERVLQTVRWMMAVAAWPFGPPVVPRFGWYSPEHKVLSLAYIPELTAHERIREFGSARSPGAAPRTSAWRKLFVRAMGVFFAGWRNSGGRIVLGPESPSNVAVLEPDFRDGAVILSMAEWKYYETPMSIVRPLSYNFYQQTASHQPWCKSELEPCWIFDACVESLGVEAARGFLQELRRELQTLPATVLGRPLLPLLEEFLAALEHRYYEPLSLRNAIERYLAWAAVNPEATPRAREQFIEELMAVYALDRLPEIARYHLYRHTYFARADAAVHLCFERLLAEMFAQPARRAAAMVELSELQSAILGSDDRAAFTRMAFPHAAPQQQVDVLAVGCERKQVVVRSHVTDKEGARYTVRAPLDASEVGKLLRLYVTAGFPKPVAAGNCFFVALDSREELIGGVVYASEAGHVAHLRGVVASPQLKGRGLHAALLEDFCARMADEGVEVVRTFFFVRRFFTEHGFRLDRRWGGLVRFLRESDETQPAS